MAVEFQDDDDEERRRREQEQNPVSTTMPVNEPPASPGPWAGGYVPYYPGGEGMPQNPNLDTRPDPFNASAEIDKIFGQSGFKAGETDLSNLLGKSPDDRAQFLSDLRSQRDVRAAPTLSAGGSGGDLDRNGDRVADPGWAKNASGQYEFRPIVPPTDPRVRTTMPAGPGGFQMPQLGQPGNQFTDPYTTQLEDRIKSQLARADSNPQLEQLMAFLDQQFAQKSQNPGYSHEDRALMNTQAFEPIEALRNASRQREMERTSEAGYLPKSGVANQRMSDADRYYDQLRTVANRDLAIKGIDRRNADLNAATGIGQMELALPAQQDAQALNLSQMLYQLPLNAQNQALAVLNGTNPQAAITSLIQLQQLQQQQAEQQWQHAFRQNEQTNAQNADIYAALGQYLSQFF